VRVVTADSNVYISALIWGGKPLQVLESAMAGEIQLMISDDILNETLRVMREKFNLPDERIAKAKEYIGGCTERVHPKARLTVITEDPDDDRILECAVESGSDTIVTGDKDLLRRGAYAGIKIVRVGEFIELGRQR
jgi:uncharacterized protein